MFGKKSKKFIAAAAAITFCFGHAPVSGARLQVPAASAPSVRRIPPGEITVPEELGTVRTGSNLNGNAQPVILIEDAHAVIDAQNSIAKILQYLEEAYGLSFAGVEGADGPLDAFLFRNFPERAPLSKVLGEYAERGELPAAAASVLRPETTALYHGIEEMPSYEKNIEAYLLGAEKQKPLLAELARLESALQIETKALYPPALFELAQKEKAWREEGKLLELFSYLAALKTPGALSHSDYPEISKIFSYLAAGGKASQASVSKEKIRAVSEKIKSSLGPSEMPEFNQRLQRFETERAENVEFLFYLRETAARLGLPFPLEPGWEEAMRAHLALESADGRKLLEELGLFLERVKKDFMTGEDIKALNSLSQRIDLVKKLVRFELSRAEWEAYKREPSGFSLSGLPEGGGAGGLAAEFGDFLENNGKDLGVFRLFYKTAEEREEAMSRRIEKLSGEKGPRAVIAGGFHTEGLARILEKRGIPWISVTPRISSVRGSEHYGGHMRGQVSWSGYFREKAGRVAPGEAFNRALAAALYKELSVTSGEAGARYIFKKWRDKTLAALALENRLHEASKYTRVIDEILFERVEAARKNAWKERWEPRVDEFIRRLALMEERGNLTPQNAAPLFTKNTAAAWPISFIFTAKTVPAPWSEGRPVSPETTVKAMAAPGPDPEAPLSELRSEEENAPLNEEARRRIKKVWIIGQDTLSMPLLNLWYLLPRLEKNFPNAEIESGLQISRLIEGKRTLYRPGLTEEFADQKIDITGAQGLGPDEVLIIDADNRLKWRPDALVLDLRVDGGIAVRRSGELIRESPFWMHIDTGDFLPFQKSVFREMGLDIGDSPVPLPLSALSGEVLAKKEELRDRYKLDPAKPVVLINLLSGYGTGRRSWDEWMTWFEPLAAEDIQFIMNGGPQAWREQQGSAWRSQEQFHRQMKTHLESLGSAHHLAPLESHDVLDLAALLVLTEESGGFVFTEHSGVMHLADYLGVRTLVPAVEQFWKRLVPPRSARIALNQTSMEHALKVLLPGRAAAPGHEVKVRGLENITLKRERVYREALLALLGQKLQERTFLSEALRAVYPEEFPAGIPGHLPIEAVIRPHVPKGASGRDITPVEIRAGGRTYVIGIYAGYFNPEQMRFARQLAGRGTGPRLGSIVPLDAGNAGHGILAAQWIAGKTIRELIAEGKWEQAYETLLSADLSMWRLGFRITDVRENFGNVMREETAGKTYIVDSGFLPVAWRNDSLFENFQNLKDAMSRAGTPLSREAAASLAEITLKVLRDKGLNPEERIEFLDAELRHFETALGFSLETAAFLFPETAAFIRALRASLESLRAGAGAPVPQGVPSVDRSGRNLNASGTPLGIDPPRSELRTDADASVRESVPSVDRSELRTDNDADTPAVWGMGEAAEIEMEAVEYTPVSGELLEPVMSLIESKTGRMSASNKGRPRALEITAHLRELISQNAVVVFEERRWGERSFYTARAEADLIRLGEGYFSDTEFAAQSLFRLAAASLGRKDGGKTETRLFSGLFGANDKFQKRHEEFVSLSADDFLRDAVRRFWHYSPGAPLFKTPHLFHHWLRHEVKYAGQNKFDVPEPVTAQGGYLFKALMSKGYHLLPSAQIRDPEEIIAEDPFPAEAYFSVIYPHLGLVKYQLNFFNEVQAVRQGVIDTLSGAVELIDHQIDHRGDLKGLAGKYPSIKHPDGRDIYYSIPKQLSADVPKRALELLIESRRRRAGPAAMLSLEDPMRIGVVTQQLLHEVFINGWMNLILTDNYVLHAVVHGAPTLEGLKKAQENLTRHAGEAFKANERWYFHQINRFPPPREAAVRSIPVIGLENGMSIEEMMPVLQSASGYVWRGYAAHDAHVRTNVPWIGLYGVDETVSIERGIVKVTGLDENPIGGLRDTNDENFYHLQHAPSEKITVQRRKKSVAAELLHWLNPGEDASQDTRDLAFYANLRAGLTKKTTHDTYYSPGGVDPVLWAGQIMRLAGIADLAFWESVPGYHESIRRYLETHERNPLFSAVFWYYTVEKHPQGLFAYLGRNLKREPRSNRLTQESAQLLLDAVFALYWTGPPRNKRLPRAKWIIKRLTSYFYFHPDGISIADEESFRKFLELPYSEGTALSNDSFADYLAETLFAEDEARSGRVLTDLGLPQDIRSAPSSRLLSARSIPLPLADSPAAQVWPEDTRYDPEEFPAQLLLYPNRHPWPGSFPKYAWWSGTYRDGLRIPGSAYKYVFTGEREVSEGTVFLIEVNAKEMTINAQNGSLGWKPLKIPLRQAQEEAEQQEEGGAPSWKKVVDFQRVRVADVPDKITMKPGEEGGAAPGAPVYPTAGVFYKISLNEEGFFTLDIDGRLFGLLIRSRRGSEVLAVFSESTITFYDPSGGRIGSLRHTAHVPELSSDAPLIAVQPALPVSVEGFDPASMADYSRLYALGANLRPLMSPASETQGGRGYSKIQMIDSDAPLPGETAPRIGTDNGSVVVPKYYLDHPEQAARGLEAFLTENDPIFRIRERLKYFKELEAAEAQYAEDFSAPELEGFVDIDGMWLRASRGVYEKLHNEARQVLRRLIILNKLDRFRRQNAGQLGPWGKTEKFRDSMEDLVRRQPDAEHSPSFFFRMQKYTTDSIEQLRTEDKRADSDPKQPYFPGMGITLGGYLDTVKGRLVFGKTIKNDPAKYIFLRFTDGTVKVFDLMTGDLIDEAERAHRQAEQDYNRQRQRLVDAVAERALNLNGFRYALDEFLASFRHPDETEDLNLKTRVLGGLTQLVPTVLQSEHPLINLAVARFIFDYAARSGREEAETRIEKLQAAYRRSAEDIHFYLSYALDSTDDALGLSPERGREDFDARFPDFLDAVLLPSARAFAEEIIAGRKAEGTEGERVKLEYINLTGAETYFVELFERITGRRRLLAEKITAHLDEHRDAAERGGVFSLRHAFQEKFKSLFGRDPDEIDLYFINEIFSQEEERMKHVPEDELRERAVYITPYGGVQGIGASSALVEYRGKGETETDAVIVDSGVRLYDQSAPSFPKTLEEFPSRPKALILTHAHRDHVSRALFLWRDRLKKSVPIYMTRGTYEIISRLPDILTSGEETEEQAALRAADAREFFHSVKVLDTGKWYAVSPKMKIYFHGPVGHLHGAASLFVSTPDSTAMLTGDVSIRPQGPVPGYAPVPEEIARNTDTVMSESTYGLMPREPEEEQEKLLIQTTAETLAQGGRVVFPAFANGRSQRILLLLLENMKELLEASSQDVLHKRQDEPPEPMDPLLKAISERSTAVKAKPMERDYRITPDLKIYIDGQAALFTRLYLEAYPKEFEPYEKIIRDHVVIIEGKDFRDIGKIRSEAEQRSGNQRTIFIASSGNASYGRSHYWVSRAAGDPLSAVIFNGYMDPTETGSKLLRAVEEGKGRYYFTHAGVDSPLKAKFTSIKVSGHASGMEIIDRILAPMSASLRRVFLGHGTIDRTAEILKWIRHHYPEWNPEILQENARYQGAVPRTEHGLEARKEFFESLEAEPLYETRSELRASSPQGNLRDEGNEPSSELRASSPQGNLRDEGNEPSSELRASSPQSFLRDEGNEPSSELRASSPQSFLSDEGNEPSSELRSSSPQSFLSDEGNRPSSELRAELRHAAGPEDFPPDALIYSDVLTALAGGRAAERLPEFVDLVRSRGLDPVLRALREEALNNPYYAAAAAGYDDGLGLPRAQAHKRAGAEPGRAQKTAEWYQETVNGLENRVRESLAADPEKSFNYSFAFAPSGSREVLDAVSKTAAVFEKLKRDTEFRGRVRASILLLVSSDETKDPRLADVFGDLRKSTVVKVIDISSFNAAGRPFYEFLRENGNALIYGAEGLALEADYENRIVKSEVPGEYALPVALLLAEKLAKEPGKISAELLSRVTANLPEFVRWDGEGLLITTLALDIVFRYQAEQLLGRSA